MPAAFSYPFSTHGQVVAAGSALGGGADSFIDLAVPWSDLANVGIARDTRVYVWAGSSTLPTRSTSISPASAAPAAASRGIDVGVTVPDPNAGGGGSGGTGGGGAGGSGGGTGPRTLEGGPGCSVAVDGAPARGWLGLGLLGLALVTLGARRLGRRR